MSIERKRAQNDKAEAPSFPEGIERLSVLVGVDNDTVSNAVETLRKDLSETPRVGRMVEAMRPEFVIPLTSHEQKGRLLDTRAELSIYPWEEDGLLIIDHIRDLDKLALAGITSAPSFVQVDEPPADPEYSYPIPRVDTLSERMQSKQANRSTIEKRPREELDSELPDISEEMRALIDRFDQGLIDEDEPQFQRVLGAFPSLRLFPRRYVWKGGKLFEARTERAINDVEYKEILAAARDGDQSAMTKVCTMNTGLVLEVVTRVKDKFGGDADDLFQAGMLGLIRAAQKYEPSQEAKFSTYAGYWIESKARRESFSLNNRIQQSDEIPRRRLKLRKLIEQFGGPITPSAPEIMGAMNVPANSKRFPPDALGLDRLTRLYLLHASFDPVSNEEDNVIDTSVDIGERMTAFPSGENAPEITAALLKKRVTQALLTLTPREERVLRMRFGIGQNSETATKTAYSQSAEGTDLYMTYEEVGQAFQVTRERVRQMEAKAIRKMRHPARSRSLRVLLDMLDKQPDADFYNR